MSQCDKCIDSMYLDEMVYTVYGPDGKHYYYDIGKAVKIATDGNHPPLEMNDPTFIIQFLAVNRIDHPDHIEHVKDYIDKPAILGMKDDMYIFLDGTYRINYRHRYNLWPILFYILTETETASCEITPVEAARIIYNAGAKIRFIMSNRN